MRVSPPIPEFLLNRAGEVFGAAEKARRWLTRPHHSLDGRSPAEAAQTEEGLKKVRNLLGRIEHGVYE